MVSLYAMFKQRGIVMGSQREDGFAAEGVEWASDTREPITWLRPGASSAASATRPSEASRVRIVLTFLSDGSRWVSARENSECAVFNEYTTSVGWDWPLGVAFVS